MVNFRSKIWKTRFKNKYIDWKQEIGFTIFEESEKRDSDEDMLSMRGPTRSAACGEMTGGSR